MENHPIIGLNHDYETKVYLTKLIRCVFYPLHYLVSIITNRNQQCSKPTVTHTSQM